MALYADTSEIQAMASEPESLDSPAAWDSLAEGASRLFDRLTEVPDDFYKAATGTATPRTFYGDGTAYLKVDPFVGTPTVAIPGSEYAVSTTDWIVQGSRLVWLAKTKAVNVTGEYPYYNRYTGWWDRVPVTVTADWGFAAIPADVKLAVIQIALMMWRQREPAVAITDGLNVQSLDIPKTARMVVDKYRGIYSQRSLFA